MKNNLQDEKFAGMTRNEVLDIARAINQESDENDEDSSSYSEYIEAMKSGGEALKKCSGYYPYLARENTD